MKNLVRRIICHHAGQVFRLCVSSSRFSSSSVYLQLFCCEPQACDSANEYRLGAVSSNKVQEIVGGLAGSRNVWGVRLKGAILEFLSQFGHGVYSLLMIRCKDGTGVHAFHGFLLVDRASIPHDE